MDESKLLVVVDMQNDFINGSLGSVEAESIVSNVKEKIEKWQGDIAYTMDTHYDNYESTIEGEKLPIVHCKKGTIGWEVNCVIMMALNKKEKVKCFEKETFGSLALADFANKKAYKSIELVGLCTDICVIMNACLIKTFCVNCKITVDATCCMGITKQSHNNALEAMKMCQIDIID
ncbi:MAG: isochorismatase family cysteine hydrolase [Clostridia bacterium]